MDSRPVSEYGVTFFRGNHHGLAKAKLGDENGLVPGTGNHKGCPYDWFAGAYFQRNHPCRLAVCTPRDENGERRLAEEFDRQWRFEPVEESVACGPSGTPSCCRSTMSEHAYQLEYMWGRPLPAISDGGKRNASVVRTMCGVGCP